MFDNVFEGYGDIAPVTTLGRMFTIIIALFGMPLLMVNIATMGQAITISFSRLLQRSRKVMKNYQICKPICRYIEKRQMKNILPFWLAILVMTSYVLLIAMLVSHLEKWGTLNSIYFSVITLATIGMRH